MGVSERVYKLREEQIKNKKQKRTEKSRGFVD